MIDDSCTGDMRNKCKEQGTSLRSSHIGIKADSEKEIGGEKVYYYKTLLIFYVMIREFRRLHYKLSYSYKVLGNKLLAEGRCTLRRAQKVMEHL